MGRNIPYMTWKIIHMFKTTNQMNSDTQGFKTLFTHISTYGPIRGCKYETHILRQQKIRIISRLANTS